MSETLKSSRTGIVRRVGLPLVVLLAAGAVAAGLIATKPKTKPVEVTERVWRVNVEDARPGRHAPTLSLFGRVESRWSTRLTAALTADVVEVAVIEGDAVSSGARLLRLDDRDARLQLAQREAEFAQAEARIAAEMRRHEADLEALPRETELLALARSEVRRVRDLLEKQVGAQSQLDTARQSLERQAIALSARQQAVDEHSARLAELEAARARAGALRDQAVLELERCVINAPFDGRVAAVPVAPGQRVRAGDPVVELYSTANMLVRAQLPSRHLPVVRAALAAGADLIADANVDGIAVRARLRSLAADAMDAAGGVDGLFDIVSADGPVPDQGRFVRLELSLPPRDGLVVVPYEALYGSDRIFLIDAESRMRGAQVERLGEVRAADGDTRLLVRIPAAGEPLRIVTTQLPNAVDGLLVSPVGAN